MIRRSLRAALAMPNAFPIVVEVTPPRHPEVDAARTAIPTTLREFVDDPRIIALSVTDGAGGHAATTPESLATQLIRLGQDVVVHMACRNRTREDLDLRASRLGALGLRSVLAVTGDYPTEAPGARSSPAFEVDSVGLITLLQENERGGSHDDASVAPFLVGAAVSPFKRLEGETILQYCKLRLKVAAGADFLVPQLGYDSRKWDELLRWMRSTNVGVPVLANIYLLSATSARLFHANRVPGCVVTDELLALVEREARSPDRGKSFFLKLAAEQIAVARGLGFAGIYLAGKLRADDVDRMLTLADTLAADWRDLAQEIQFSPAGSFYLYERDPGTGLNSDRLSTDYLESLTPASRRRMRRRVPPAFRVNRLVHDLAFTPGRPGYRVTAAAYRAVGDTVVGDSLHVLERLVKAALFDCRDCGDCSLPDVAYLCPVSQCPKGARNGPCGGSRDGLCEVAPQRCVWIRAYERLKPYGEELEMLDRPPVISDSKLRHTSAWTNTYLGRDYRGRPRARTAASVPLGAGGRPTAQEEAPG
jgi:methylenetetrahydrofolate reductase (NADPH)